ncbi:MAG TPA: hypothetical protein PK079_08890 [Leptospiraceae bacterium]|nr:hypothetical protein [Leptospiraceae bacterium]HMW04235.1 hypothetical protein [Leptospiraceae bacterium]HMY31281.1 hypothetical protein [Leptospiraceae bacterium]HMZ63394.1 hypothetical protein [Leptospiraceae bacterium]HNA09216.1 hypothetical protein [Leptospiraceae bacterium]
MNTDIIRVIEKLRYTNISSSDSRELQQRKNFILNLRDYTRIAMIHIRNFPLGISK